MSNVNDTTPRRVQRKREKGWRLPENTKCVTRPGPWGNPFDSVSEFSEAVECCSELRHVPEWMDFEKGQRILWMCEHLDELKGLNLACWCPPEKRCHADMLLIWANCETSKRNPRLSLSDHMERTHSKRWAGEKLGFAAKESKDETMTVENDDWESERVYGHTIERPKDDHRCQVKAKVQCVLQEHMTKDKALHVAEEIVAELGL